MASTMGQFGDRAIKETHSMQYKLAEGIYRRQSMQNYSLRMQKATIGKHKSNKTQQLKAKIANSASITLMQLFEKRFVR